MTGMVIYLPTADKLTDSTPVSPGPTPDAADVAGWSQLDVLFPETDCASGLDVVAVILDGLCAHRGGRWWFLNHDKGWRVYLQDLLVEEAILVLNWPGVHDNPVPWTATSPPTPAPRLTRPRSTQPTYDADRRRALMDLHCADSRGVLDCARDRPLLAPRHIAGILTTVICRAAGLSDAQTADFVDEHWLGAAPVAEPARIRAHGLTEMLSALLRTPAAALLDLDPYAARWAAELTHAATRLGAANQGFLPTPRTAVPEALRLDLRLVVAAQWNRLGFSPTDQQILAVAIRNALWSQERR
jgi:hypothetical protein